MGAFQNLINGLGIALQPMNFLYCLIGVVIGECIGILPGLGAMTAISVLLPLTFNMSPLTAMIMFTGIYYGCMYGGAVSSILLRAPGTSAAVITAIDGYELTQQGRAGAALATAAIASFGGSVLGIIGLVFLAEPLAKVALSFGPAEYFSAIAFCFVVVSFMSDAPPAKVWFSIFLGLILSTIGIDPQVGVPRMTFGFIELWEGLDFIVLAMGLFAFGEVINMLSKQDFLTQPAAGKGQKKEINLSITWQEFISLIPVIIRQSIVGFIVGVIPGIGATTSVPLSYSMEKRISKNGAKFGKGSLEGVAACESSNNASVFGAFVPMLSLGIPGSGTTAIMLTALMILGITPGPLLFIEHPDIIHGLNGSFLVGNALLLIISLPLVKYFAKMLDLPRDVLIVSILVIIAAGTFAVYGRTFDFFLLIFFGLLGTAFRKFGFPLAPVLVSLVLGTIMETYFRRALSQSGGDLMIFIRKPISLCFLMLSLAMLIIFIVTKMIERKKHVIAN